MDTTTKMTVEQAAEGLMHLIATSRVNAKFDDPSIERDVRPLLCGSWDRAHGDEIEAVNVIAELAGYGPDAYADGGLSYFWIDGFGNELVWVRTPGGIIRKAKASAKAIAEREARS